MPGPVRPVTGRHPELWTARAGKGILQGVRPSAGGCLAGVVLAILGSVEVSVAAEPLWPRAPTAALVVTAAPFAPSLSEVQLSVPADRIIEAELLDRLDLFAWYLADSAWLYPVSYLEVGAGLRIAWLERRRLLLESGIGTALSVQTLTGTVSVPLLLDSVARCALSPSLCLQSGIEVLLFGEGFSASGQLGVRWRPFRFGLLLGASAGYGCVAEWDLSPGGGAVRLTLSAGYTL